ncbi:MAG: SMP-30/gluconolactonase/LRE family protein [Planctomycetaceae bacterium]
MTHVEESPFARRRFLAASAAFGAGLYAGFGTPSDTRADGIGRQYAGLNSGDYLGSVKIETEIKDKTVFTEGPAVDRKGDVYFTNVPVEKVLKWDPAAKRLRVFRTKSNKANGLLFEPDGSLLACEGGAGRVTRTDMRTGKIAVVADKYNGFPFAAPNDIARDKKGRLYFTSRPGAKDPKKGNVNAVYRIDPDGRVQQLLRYGARSRTSPKRPAHTDMPNGIVTSPDDMTLYLIEAHPDARHRRNIMAYGLADDGRLTGGRVLIDFYPGRSGDGMCIDAKGNLYVAAGLHKTRNTSETLDTRPGIHVISPAGKLLAYRKTPVDTITNCTFGGKNLKTLYVACGKYLLSIRTEVPGKADYRPNA